MRLMVSKESRSAAMETDWIAEKKMNAPVIFHWKKISLNWMNSGTGDASMYWSGQADKSEVFSSPDSTLENYENKCFQSKAYIYFWELNKKLFLHTKYVKKTNLYKCIVLLPDFDGPYVYFWKVAIKFHIDFIVFKCYADVFLQWGLLTEYCSMMTGSNKYLHKWYIWGGGG